MKIFALNTSINNNNFKKTKSVKNTSLNLSYKSDTVSFKSSDYISEGLKFVDNVIDTKLKPFMNDSKQLYMNTAKIGYIAQESLKNFKEQEEGFRFFKMDLAENAQNPVFSKTEKYFLRASKYEDNIHIFNNLSRLSKSDCYNKPEIKEPLKELKTLIYSSDKNLNKVKDFASFFEENKSNLENALDDITLKNADPHLLQRMGDTKERHMGALYYIMMTPFNDSVNLIKERNALEEDSKKIPRDLYTILKRLDHLQQEAERVAKSTKFYYENKDKISLFIDSNRECDESTPSKDDIKKVYSSMKKNCKEIVRNNNEFFEKEFTENYAEKLEKIDLDSVDKLLNAQSEKADKIQSMINEIKMEIIRKNNEEFERKNGFNFDD